MQILQEQNKENLTSKIRILIDKSDYEESVNKKLREIKKNLVLDGFRPGMVPISLVSKMYKKSVTVDEVVNVVESSLNKYLQENKINILGDPLVNDEKTIDWENSESFEFEFEIGHAPAIDLVPTSKDKFVKYKIKIDEDTKQKYLERLARKYGKFESAEVSNENSMIFAKIYVEDNNTEIKPQIANIDLHNISKKNVKSFINLKVKDQIEINFRKLQDDEIEFASIKFVPEPSKKATYKLEVVDIKNVVPAEINLDLYKKILSLEGEPTQEEINAKLLEYLEKEYDLISTNKLKKDIKAYYLDKIDVDFPVEFLKKWLKRKNNVTDDKLNETTEEMIHNIKWIMFIDKIAKENSIEIKEEEIYNYASTYYQLMFYRYGYFINQEELDSYVVKSLSNENNYRHFQLILKEEKAWDHILKTVKIEIKELPFDKYEKAVLGDIK